VTGKAPTWLEITTQLPESLAIKLATTCI